MRSQGRLTYCPFKSSWSRRARHIGWALQIWGLDDGCVHLGVGRGMSLIRLVWFMVRAWLFHKGRQP